jgi:hypothetical protein
MTISIRFLCLAILAWPGHAALATSLDGGGGWRLLTAREGIIVFRQFHAQSQLKTFRGVMRMELPDEYAMLALYNDVPAMPEWLHLITEASELGRDHALDRDLRFQIDLPWPVGDREAIVNAVQEQIITPEREAVVTTLTGRPKLAPPDKDFVRIPELHGVFTLERVKPRIVEVTFQVRLDMGGWIPNWMVNIFLRDMPYYTLKRLREKVREQPYQNQYFDYLDLFGPGRPDSLPPPKSWVYDTVNDAPETRETAPQPSRRSP